MLLLVREDVLNLNEFEELARARMDPGAFDYYAGGGGDEITLAENLEAFRRRRLRPRVLVDVAAVSLETTILGQPCAMPVGLAPTALHGLAHPDGELASARAAAAAGVIFCLSTLSSRSLEEVADDSSGRRWFQLYVHKDRGVSRDLVQRAEAAGYEAVVLTVDLPVTGYRERELRRSFSVAPDAYGSLADFSVAPDDLISTIANLHDQSLQWSDIAWLRGLTTLPIIVKGILRGDDAQLAVDHGAAAVVVSNHGGRQLDRSLASLDALEEVVAAVDGRAEVYMDGGVRRGIDVVTALALGARAAFIGRPVLYALAAAGTEGVARALGLLHAELVNAMALLGTPSVADIRRDHVA